jgi:hypothetical protein
MGLFIVPSGVVHAGNIVNEATTHLEVANMVSQCAGQRQLEFPILFERYQQQSGLWEKWESRGFCGISKGGGKGGKPVFGFPRFPPPGFFHSPRPPHFYY